MARGTVPFDYRLKPRLDTDASIGLVALASDATIEREWRRLLDLPGVGFYAGRIASPKEVTPEGLRTMEPLLAGALERLLPDSHLDCVAFACTSASLLIGEEVIGSLIRRTRPGAAVTNPMTAVRAALAALGARRVAMLTPYLDSINEPMADSLEAGGFEITALGSFFNSRDPDVVRIDEDSIRHAAGVLARDGNADTVFIACTALAGAALVDELERRTGLSVITSNHALAWHALRQAGCGRTAGGRGRLFELPLADAPTLEAVNSS